jgi:hypothetical protein
VKPNATFSHRRRARWWFVRATLGSLVAMVVALVGMSLPGSPTWAGGDGDHPQGVDSSGQPLQPPGAELGDLATASDLGPIITRAQILARAQTWVDAKVPYSQSAYRDGYRTDCSGYVSMA